MIQTTARLLFGVAIIFLLFTQANAETMYVNDSMKITFRTGPGNDRKITALLSIGQKVEVLESSGDWAQIQLPDGEQGWVLSQYLTGEVPCSIEIEKLKQVHQNLKMESTACKEENNVLKNEVENITKELKTNTASLQKTQTQYDTLKKDSAHFIKLKAEHEKTVTELSQLKQRADLLEEELSVALRTQHIKWFLSGAGIMVLGMIIGFTSKREKRRSSLL